MASQHASADVLARESLSVVVITQRPTPRATSSAGHNRKKMNPNFFQPTALVHAKDSRRRPLSRGIGIRAVHAMCGIGDSVSCCMELKSL